MPSFVSQEQRISVFFNIPYMLVGFFLVCLFLGVFFGALEKFLHSGEKCEHESFYPFL